VRAMGVKETESPDFISMLTFEPEFTRRLIELGQADAASRIDEIRAFLGDETPQIVAAG
jgi:NTE family protein